MKHAQKGRFEDLTKQVIIIKKIAIPLIESIKKTLDRLEKQSKLERTKRLHIKPEDRMLAITYETGQFLHSLLIGIKAKDALELGMSTGYSTLWVADALLSNHKNPKITSIERNTSKIQRARRNFEDAKVSRLIDIRHGEILDILEKIPTRRKFDFALIDADKENIRKYADLVLPRLKIGGIMMTDNMLYPKKYRKPMKAYSTYLAARSDVQTCTLPIGNGEEITIRTK